MIKAEPALLHLWGQTGEAFIHRRPVSEMSQSFRFAVLQRLLQMEPTFVVHIVVEVDIHPRGGIVQQKPARLRQRETVRLWVYQYRSDTERGFQETLHGIVRQTRLSHNLLSRQSLVSIPQQVEDAPFHHQSRRLEHHGSPGNELRQPLCVPRTQLFLGIFFLQCLTQFHRSVFIRVNPMLF